MADKTPVIYVVGAESLLGREVVDVLGSAKLPAHVKVASAIEPEQPSKKVPKEQKGEAVFPSPLRPGELAGSRVVLLADTGAPPEKIVEAAQAEPDPPILIDVTGALEDNPAARLRAPMVETATQHASAPIYAIAHPAAIALALFLKQLATAGAIRRVVAVVFEPASERGKKGLDELQQQTVSLLSFQKLKKEVFDTQVSFNMLPRLGSDALKSLEEVEAAVERHLATLLSSEPGIPMPSFRVVQAPVFHGYSFSVWVEFEDRPSDHVLAAALSDTHIEVRGKEEEPPSNVGAAGQSGITVGGIGPDRNDPRACWFWIVADNLRLTAENAVEVAREVLE